MVCVVRLQQVIGEDTPGMLIAGCIRFPLLRGAVDELVRRRAIPGRTAGIMIDIVRPAQRINASLPARRKLAVLIDVGIKTAHLGIGAGRGRNGRLGRGWCG